MSREIAIGCFVEGTRLMQKTRHPRITQLLKRKTSLCQREKVTDIVHASFYVSIETHDRSVGVGTRPILTLHHDKHKCTHFLDTEVKHCMVLAGYRRPPSFFFVFPFYLYIDSD